MPQPNFLIFVTDQMQAASLSCAGNPDIETPNIDKLAAGGVRFANGYANNTVCMPSRATMLTGLTPRQHGLLTNGCKLPEHIPTLTEKLAAHGYRTYSAGKLHLQPFGSVGEIEANEASCESWKNWEPGGACALPSPYYGFQECDFVGGHVYTCFGDYKVWLDRNHPGAFDLFLERNATYVGDGAYRMAIPPELHYNHWIADRTISRLERFSAGNSPFFIWCSFPDPHFPFAAAAGYADRYEPDSLTLPPDWEDRTETIPFLRESRAHPQWNRALSEARVRECMAQTYGMISHVDDNVGRVMDALHRNGLAENTIVVFMSDHGEYLGGGNLLGKSVWPREELLKVPFIWKAPGCEHPGAVLDTPVSLLDFVPTIIGYAGIDQKEFDIRGAGSGARPGLPGQSLARCMATGREPPEVPVLVEYDEDWQEDTPLCRMRGVVYKGHKLMVWADYAEGLLINLADDPLGKHNLFCEPEAAGIKLELYQKLVDRLAYTDRFDVKRICGA